MWNANSLVKDPNLVRRVNYNLYATNVVLLIVYILGSDRKHALFSYNVMIYYWRATPFFF